MILERSLQGDNSGPLVTLVFIMLEEHMEMVALCTETFSTKKKTPKRHGQKKVTKDISQLCLVHIFWWFRYRKRPLL